MNEKALKKPQKKHKSQVAYFSDSKLAKLCVSNVI